MKYNLILLILVLDQIYNKKSKPRKILEQNIKKKPAFTQGLIIIDDKIIESSGLYGKSYLVEYDINNCLKINRKINFPRNIFLEGITFFNNTIIALTWKEDIAYLISYPEFKIIKEINNFNLTFDSKQGWGITYDYDNNRLIVSDGTNKLYFLDPNNFSLLKTLETPYRYLNELEYIDGYLLANIWYKNYVLKINMKNNVIEKLYFPKNYKGVLNGIAFCKKNNFILITGKRWDYFLKI